MSHQWRNSSQRGFRVGYTARIFPYEAPHHKYISCNSNAWQIEWGFQFHCVVKVLNELLHSSLLQKEMSQLLGIKTNIWDF